MIARDVVPAENKRRVGGVKRRGKQRALKTSNVVLQLSQLQQTVLMQTSTHPLVNSPAVLDPEATAAMSQGVCRCLCVEVYAHCVARRVEMMYAKDGHSSFGMARQDTPV